MKNLYYLPIVVLAAVIVVGCKESNMLVQDAKTSYNEAMSDSAVSNGAPVALREANDELKAIDNLKKNGASKEQINHHAYIAQQKVASAYQIAELNATQDKIEKAEKERQLAMTELQQAEALAAQRRAEQARKESEAAQLRAQELSQKVSDMQAEQTERGIVLTLNNVLFDFGKTTLKLGTEESLAKVARFLLEYPERKVMVEGFTDNVGSKESNQKLSLKRAETIKQALMSRGIAEDRIQTRGYGEDFAVADNKSATGRQLNRRVELVISDEYGNLTERRQNE